MMARDFDAMRRRSRMKTLKILRLFAQGRIVVFLILVFCSYVLGEPGYLDFDNLPETNFTCAGKVIGGYYADLETSCQMFHVCTIGQLDEPMDIKFLCLNGTVFDQETRVCERVDEVDCTKSEKFYYLNLELYGNTMVPIPEDNEPVGEIQSESTSTSTSTTTTTTAKPTTTSTYKPTTPTSTLSPKKSAVPSTTISTPTHFLSTTAKPFDELIDEEEYEYEDDYLTTDGKDLQNYQDPNSHKNGNEESLAQHVFSPQQFIFHQNNGKGQSTSALKPAISFQQQQFQNGGTLTVTNSHVTVTTHTSPGQQGSNQGQQQSNANNPSTINNNHNVNVNKQFSSKPKQNTLLGYSSSSTTSKPQYSFYNTPSSPDDDKEQSRLPAPHHSQTTSTSPKRIPLLTTSDGHDDLSDLQPFRIQAQGFRLPHERDQEHAEEQQHIFQQQQHSLLQKQLQPQAQASSFEGYRRHMPQITLRLPIDENRAQKELLGFDALDEDFPNHEHKDLKRSDPHATITTTLSTSSSSKSLQETLPPPSRNQTQYNSRNNNHSETHHEVHHITTVTGTPKSRIAQSRSSSVSTGIGGSAPGPSNYDKVLLTPQGQFIPTLPKVIITASASVSDATGKKLNYSVGNVIGSNIKLPPLTYDEYREDDVGLDPFFLDVPKITPRRVKRGTKLRIRGSVRTGHGLSHGFVLKKKKRKLKLRLL